MAAIFSQRAHVDQQRRADTSAAPVGVPAVQQWVRQRQRQRRQDTQQRVRLMARPSLPLLLPPLQP